jgi:hypothetical protein
MEGWALFLIIIALALSVSSIVVANIVRQPVSLVGPTGATGPIDAGNVILPVEAGGTNSDSTLVGGKLMVSNSSDQIVEGTSSTEPSFNRVLLQGANREVLFGPNNQQIVVTAEEPAINRQVLIPDVLTNSNFVLTEGTQSINGNKTFSGQAFIQNLSDPLSNQIKFGSSVLNTSIVVPLPLANRAVTLIDAGVDSEFVLNQGASTINGSKTLTGDLVVAGAATVTVGTGTLTSSGIIRSSSALQTTGTGALNIAGTSTLAGIVSVTNTTASLTTTTGALKVAGGLGIVGNLTTASLAAVSGPSFSYQLEVTKTTTQTLLASDLFAGVIRLTGVTAGIVLTLPNGSDIETAVSAFVTPYIGLSFDFTIWNSNTNSFTLAVMASGGTTQILPSNVQATVSVRSYRAIRSAPTFYVVYNLN